ncbi:2-hydroxychromene-2-carboxylate isomerase [Pseudorhodoferax sp.]|uniref:2-hydroxychromene-2-carboxylate isomerase n=1 Tax=Pseudorhodoferax sp. TaxID=1993553 RepID=UPI002DD67C7A|nr:2-hydroxychromene-2-carboxylate isomerase [Pseudorhodoferax sp.]
MKTIRFYFDPISPYAALAFWRLPEVLAGRSYAVDYLPILFGALLKANASKGPAEIPAKRDWTYRQVLWLARQQGVDLRLPAAHPFNPLAQLRLAWACAPDGLTPSRWVVERLFDHVWRAEGADPNDPERLAQLAQQLAPQRVADEALAKQRLREATDAALAAGVFGVPTFEVDGKRIWGQDSLPMLAALLDGDPWFDGPDWEAVRSVPVGVVRA